MNFYFIPIFLLTLLFSTRAQSQLDKVNSAIETEITSICDTGFIKDLNYTSSSREPLKMSIYSRGFSPPLKYEGPPEIIFFRPSAITDFQFDASATIVGKIALPAGAPRVLLLFERVAPGSEENYKIHALDNSLSQFPAGSYRFFNTSKSTLLGYLGSTKFTLKPNQTQIVTASGADQHNNVELRFFRPDDDTGQMTKIYSSVWNIKKNRRSTVFITPSKTRTKKLSIRKIVEPL